MKNTITTILAVSVSFGLLVAGMLIEEPPVFVGFLLMIAAAVIAVKRLDLLNKIKIDTSHPSFYISLLVAVIAYPVVFTSLDNSYWIHVATIAGIYICLAMGLNITVGFTGLLDLGYVAFYAIGAYTSAIFFKAFPELTWAFWFLLPAGAFLAAGAGLLVGIPTLRLRGDYLAIVTLGFGEIVRMVLTNWGTFTNGPKGISGIPGPALGGFSFEKGMELFGLEFPRITNNYFLIYLLAALMGFAVYRLNHSRIGRAWVAIREDELAAEAMGINTTAFKLLAFAIGASFAGMGGVLYANTIGFVDPMSFIFMESAMILSMVVLGGMGSLPGVILGAFVLVVLPEKLRDFQQYRMLLFGAALIAMMVFQPEGLIPSKRRQLEFSYHELDPADHLE
ncbi:MAG: branched-chain amino acid ABC transporter permease [bacterium]